LFVLSGSDGVIKGKAVTPSPVVSSSNELQGVEVGGLEIVQESHQKKPKKSGKAGKNPSPPQKKWSLFFLAGRRLFIYIIQTI
jgi:hypothetical protein